MNCNLDIGGCTANNGEPCEDCRRWMWEQEREHAWMRTAVRQFPRTEEQGREEMKDAGRGRLLP